ncbi:MAG: hypothetical protein AAB563_02850 [Patescibacteria group bacterium]
MSKELQNQILIPMMSGVRNFYPVDESLATNGSDEKHQNIWDVLQSRVPSFTTVSLG